MIAITGYGSISAAGHNKDAVLESYVTAKALHQLREFNDKQYAVGVLDEASEAVLQTLKHSDKHYKRLDRMVLLSMLAAQQAVSSHDWSHKKRVAVNIGSSRGAVGLYEELHRNYLASTDKSAFLLTSPLTTLGNVSSETAAYLNVKAMCIDNSTTCSTALQAIGNGMAWLKSGMADAFIAGGSEAPITAFTLAQTEALGIYSTDIDIDHLYPSRPYADEEIIKNTFTLGEGAAVFALEQIDAKTHLMQKPLAIIDSIGFAYNTPPSATGLREDGSLLVESMQHALSNMETNTPVDLILMHGTGTIKGDAAEMQAIQTVFGEDMPMLYTNKWMLGHTYGASAALHLELALLCLNNSISLSLPYKNKLHNSKQPVKKIMINATGFGGNAASLIIRKF